MSVLGRIAVDRYRMLLMYKEVLPEDCPPDAAAQVEQDLAVFRLVRTNPPTDSDFRSQRAEKPTQVFAGVTECQARGLSVHTQRSDSVRARKLPSLRGRLICRILLRSGAGRIQQTARPSHHTWWPLADYDILARCVVETT